MKSMVKLSVVAFAAILCFAACAFGQDTVNTKLANPGFSALNAPSALFTIPLGFGGNNGNNSNGCSNKSSNSWDGWGWGDGGNNGGCAAVPEGGTTLTYLSLAGLFCLGAFAFRSRRQSSILGTRN